MTSVLRSKMNVLLRQCTVSPREGECTVAPKKMNVLHQGQVSPRGSWMYCCTNDQYPQEEDEYTTTTMNSIPKTRVRWMHCCTNDQYPQEEDEYTTATMNSIPKTRVRWMHCCTNDQYPQEKDEYTTATMNSITKGKMNVLLHRCPVSQRESWIYYRNNEQYP